MRYLVRARVRPNRHEALLEAIQDAHSRKECRHEDGSEPWSCDDCDCTARLEAKLAKHGDAFVASLRRRAKRA